jgi:predicted component of type VI protein secretion system
MNKKVLVLEKNSKIELIELNKDKIVIGRDATCDVVLDDGAISRKHAVVLVQFDQVYIENVSSSGQILRGEDPVEYVQMDEEAEFHLGPYTLFWKRQSETKLREEVAALEQRNQDEANAEDLSNILPDDGGRDPNATVPSTPDDNSQEDPFAGVRAEAEVAAGNPGDSGADNGAFALVSSEMNPPDASSEGQGGFHGEFG